MKEKKSSGISEKLHDKIISVAYGDGSLLDKFEVWRESGKNDEVKTLLEQYIATAKAVHALPEDECPDELLHAAEVYSGARVKKNKTFLDDLYSLIFAKPIYSLGVTSVLIISFVLSVIFFKPESYNGYSREELELANKQTKEALAIVGNIFNIAQTKITDDVLEKRVGKPINEGINTVNDLFKEKGETK